MGAAPGVGTTFAMLAEGQRRARRGTRVVIGMADIRDRPRTADLLAGLERVAPRHLCASDGASVDALDVERILSRMPAVVLVDDLAARGASTGVTAGRWEDVEPLLASGADVIATIRISQIESLGDVVARITGEVETQTVPDSFVRAADQIELVDMTPEALRRRLAHGNIVAPEHVDATIAGQAGEGQDRPDRLRSSHPDPGAQATRSPWKIARAGDDEAVIVRSKAREV